MLFAKVENGVTKTIKRAVFGYLYYLNLVVKWHGALSQEGRCGYQMKER